MSNQTLIAPPAPALLESAAVSYSDYVFSAYAIVACVLLALVWRVAAKARNIAAAHARLTSLKEENL